MKFPNLQLRTDTFLPGLAERLHRFRPRLKLPSARFRRSREPVHIEAPSTELVCSFRTFSKWASIIAMVAGYHVFLGWLFGIQILMRPWAGSSPMTINSAVCSILAGIALYFLQTRRGHLSSKKKFVVPICAFFLGFISLLTLLQYAFGTDTGVDRWLLGHARYDAIDAPFPGRMSLTTTAAFLGIAVAVLFLDGVKYYRWAEVLGLSSAAISLLAIAGYFYGAPTFEGQIPLYAAVTIFFLSIGILCVHADRGFMAKVTSNSFGGIMARRLLPATLIIPVVLGWLQHWGYRAGLYSAEPGLAFFAVAHVIVFVSVVWWGVNSLHRMDTKRRMAEHELQETAAKLARSNADLEQFAYVASHDLKEPLRAISGSVQILQEQYRGRMGAEADEVIKHTVDGATRMQTLIDDLLTYSRLTTREAPLTPTNFNQVFQESLANLERAISESRAVVTSDNLPVLPADRTQMLQVFQNLISNGIKYRSERTPKIHISAEDKGNEWLFSVRDNGIGISPQYADRIFRIFQRLHTRKEYPGTGIGLAVCKKIVERHGGHIWVDSEPEEGSTFFFTIAK